MTTSPVVSIRIGNRLFRALPASSLPEGAQPLSPALAWATLQRTLLHPTDPAALAHLGQAISGHPVSPSPHIHLRPIQDAIRSGRWLLLPPVAESTLARAVPQQTESVSEQLRTATELKTWIEMEVVDEEGKPMSGQPFVLMLPDGKLREGTLDSRGRARFDGIDPGTCAFSLPSLDQQSWQRK